MLSTNLTQIQFSETLSIKLVSIAFILLVNVLAGALPYFCILKNRKNNCNQNKTATNTFTSSRLTIFLSLANCFASGVFLATCFVGLYPSVEMKFDMIVVMMSLQKVSYPIPETILISGFFAVWFLERLLHKLVDYFMHSNQSYEIVESCVDRKVVDKVELLHGDFNSEDLVSDIKDRHFHHSHNESADESCHSHQLGSNILTEDESGTKLIKVMFLTFALGSHSILEGIGFGLMDKSAQAINMAVAMVIHESLCAFSLGLQLAGQNTKPRVAMILLSTFACLIPVGIGIGLSITMTEQTLSGQIAGFILQGVAAGTFIYVVFLEILPPELKIKSNSIWKVFFTAVGFALISIVRLFSGHH